MKKVFKKSWSLFVTMVLIAGLFPMSTLAEGDFSGNTNDLQQNQSAAVVPMADENGAVMMVAAPAGETALPMTNVSAFVFVNGQAICLSDTKEDVPMKTATSQSSAQLKEELPQNAILNAEIQTDSVDNAYEVTDVYGGVRITKYTGSGGDVVVPATLNGKMVLEIGERAFYSNDSLISITLPEGLKKIGRAAFFSCSSLTMVSFPESLEAIDGWAFGACNKLTSISLPQNISFIGENPFNQCHSLTSISVSPLNPNYQVLNGLLVNKSGKTVIICPSGAVSAIIPEGVTAIGDSAFFGCRKITNIDLPESVISIGNSTFFYSGLISITLSKNISHLGTNPFSDCNQLTAINVDESNANYTSLDGVLYNKNRTALIGFPGGKTSITIPGSVAAIGDDAFRGCDNLTSIVIPQGVTSIGNLAFFSCRNLTALDISESVTSLGRQALSYCPKLTKVIMRANTIHFEYYMFSGSPLVTIYGIPGSDSQTYAKTNNIPFIDLNHIAPIATLQSIAITSPATKLSYQIGETLDLTGLTVTGTYSDGTTRQIDVTANDILGFDSSSANSAQVITINIDGITTTYTIEIVASDVVNDFEYIDIVGGIRIIKYTGPGGNVTIPATINDKPVLEIGDYAFRDCSSLTTITIPDSVTIIGNCAFLGCSSLTTINLPDSVNRIGEAAFYHCSSLTSIQINSANTEINYNKETFPTTTTIIGHNPSTAKDFAVKYNRTFIEIGEDKTLKEIAITSPAQKLIYKVGEALDLTGLSVIGTYDDGTTRQLAFTADNILGFDSSYPETNQVLTIAIEGITTTYTVQIIASDKPIQGGLAAFLLKDVNGNFYEYGKDDINYSFVVYQINPELPGAKMYQHFSGILAGGGKVVGVKDTNKGYMDYQAAVTAFMIAQFAGQPFDMNAYLALNSAKKLTEAVTNVHVVNKDGNLTGTPSYSIAFYSLVTPGKKMVSVILNVDNPAAYHVSYNGTTLVYNDEFGAFQAEISSSTSQTLIPVITPV